MIFGKDKAKPMDMRDSLVYQVEVTFSRASC
jgi:hypothetical protein